jgi:hypothetical protein
MFLMGAAIYLAIVFFIGVPVIRRLTRPLNANHPLVARFFRMSLWVVVLSLATWPIGLGPLLFKMNCAYFTKFQVEPLVDARATGYLDERLSDSEHVASHMDSLFMNKDVEDLVAGRIAFFEMRRTRSGLADETSKPYLRYSLMEIGSPTCSQKVFGFSDGQGLLVSGAPGKCVAIESVPSAMSQYQVRGSGNVNQSDGSTEIFEKSTDKVIAIFRSFHNSSLFGSGSYCPKVEIEGEIHSAHMALTKLVFMDKKGVTRKAKIR